MSNFFQRYQSRSNLPISNRDTPKNRNIHTYIHIYIFFKICIFSLSHNSLRPIIGHNLNFGCLFQYSGTLWLFLGKENLLFSPTKQFRKY